MTMNQRNKKPITETFIGLLTLLGNPNYSSKNYNDLNILIRARILIILFITAPLLGVISIYIQWKDTHRRFLVLQDIIFGGNSIVAINGLIYSPNICKTLINVMKYSSWFKNNKYISKNNIYNIINEANTFSWNLAWFMILGMITFWIFVCIIPFIVFIFNMISNEEINMNDINTPIPSFNILTIENNLVILTLNFIIQVIIFTIQLMALGVWLLLESCSLVYISYELKLLSITILNIDTAIKELNECETKTNNMKMEINSVKLKMWLQNIHRHHLRIIQKIKNINKCLKVSLLVFNQNICLFLSVILYQMFQNNKVTGKGRFIMALLSTINCYGMTCITGQLLVNKSNDLWRAVALSPRQNKPLWFQDGIRMLLIGTQEPLKLEPAGIYVLDLNFLLKVLQVSYSYCNLMLQLNNSKK